MYRLLPFLLVAALLGLPGTASAQSTGTAGAPPDLSIVTVNAGPGDQTDPHVSGNWIAYTSELNGASEIRVHNLATGTDEAIPTNGGYDFLPDVSGTTVVYTHLTTVSSIYAYDVATDGPPTEVDPTPNSDQREARIGGHTVVWQDFSFNSNANAPELVAYDLNTGVATRLTDDTLLDRDPAISPDGNVIVWTKCQQDSTGCHIWEATRSGDGWLSKQLTSGTSEEGHPDTDGSIVVYSTLRLVNGQEDEDIAWQPVGGGPQQVLRYDDRQTDPNVSNGVIGFEGFDSQAYVPNFDTYVYDTVTGRLYRLTDTPQDETLNDISASAGPDRSAVMTWTREDADYNVYAATFNLSLDTTPPVLSLPATITVDATSPAGASVTYTVTATDDTDPNPTVSCTPASGSTFPIGTTTVDCTATDASGNSASGSFDVHVNGPEEQVDALIALVESYNLPDGMQTSLLAKLQAAQSYLAAGDTADACSSLTAFEDEVRAQSGKDLTADLANQLLAAAQQIQAAAGC